MNKNLYTHTHTHTHIYIYIYICISNKYIFILFIHVYVCVCVRVNPIYIHIYLYLYIYVCMHIGLTLDTYILILTAAPQGASSKGPGASGSPRDIYTDDDMYTSERHLPTPGQRGHSPERHTAAGTAASTTTDTGNTVPQRANPTQTACAQSRKRAEAQGQRLGIRFVLYYILHITIRLITTN